MVREGPQRSAETPDREAASSDIYFSPFAHFSKPISRATKKDVCGGVWFNERLQGLGKEESRSAKCTCESHHIRARSLRSRQILPFSGRPARLLSLVLRLKLFVKSRSIKIAWSETILSPASRMMEAPLIETLRPVGGPSIL